MRSLLAFLVAVNPPAVAAALCGAAWPPRARLAATGLAAAVTIIAAGASEPLLDLLDVSAPTFRTAAGVVLGASSVRALVVGGRPLPEELEPAGGAGGGNGWRGVVVPLFVPVLFTPPLLAVAMSVGADEGLLLAASGTILALGSAVVASAPGRGRRAVWSAAARLTAVAGVAVALAIAVDGVQSV